MKKKKEEEKKKKKLQKKKKKEEEDGCFFWFWKGGWVMGERRVVVFRSVKVMTLSKSQKLYSYGISNTSLDFTNYTCNVK